MPVVTVGYAAEQIEALVDGGLRTTPGQ